MSQDKPVLSREQIQLRKKRIHWMRSGEHLEGQVPPPRINLTTEQELALCDLALSALDRQGWIAVGEVVDIADGLGTCFVEWNEERWKMKAGDIVYAAPHASAQINEPLAGFTSRGRTTER